MPLDLERALAADYEAVAAAIEKRYGRLDGLLHNAALLGALTPIDQYDVPTFMRVMHVNVTAAFVLTQHLLPLLRASRDASVLFTSSGVGKRGRAYWGAYSVSKFAVEGLAQVLAHETEGNSQGAREHHRPGQGAHRDAPPGVSVRGAGIVADAGVAHGAVPSLVGPGEPRCHGPALRGAGGAAKPSYAAGAAREFWRGFDDEHPAGPAGHAQSARRSRATPHRAR